MTDEWRSLPHRFSVGGAQGLPHGGGRPGRAVSARIPESQSIRFVAQLPPTQELTCVEQL